MLLDRTSIFVEAAAAFANLHPRMRIAFAPSAIGANVTMIWLGPSGAIEAMTEQDVHLGELDSVSDERARAFFAGCASALRSRLDAGVQSDSMFPADVLNAVVLRAPTLVTADDFARALLDPWGIRMQLEIDELCAQYARAYPEAIAAIADDVDRELVDALFGLRNDRHATSRSLRLLQDAAAGDRRHVAPILSAFIDLAARDEDFQHDAHLANEVASRILGTWGAQRPN